MDFNGQFYDTPIILGRPFLHTAKMNIDFPTDDLDDPDVIDDCVLEELEEIENINLEEKKEEDHLNLELKPLPSSLKYMFLEENNSFPVIIAADLSNEQEEELLDEGARTSRKPQRRLNPNMMEIIANGLVLHK
ncbi:unnamed protein product [Spirodela intermedia]|uniref:Uncharacterized protein n=1 Tax=Spirodela intermedia TaxID=51605 RepID=A0A7I8KWB9_SPIIN|nr:unnamed protein product [Spirodela intermedia]